MTYTLDDFDFSLPAELIAQQPAAQRTHSRLLHVQGNSLVDRVFPDLRAQLKRGDVLVFNNTKVMKARLFATKPSGGKVEILIERVLDDSTSNSTALAMLRASHLPRVGSSLVIRTAQTSVAPATSPVEQNEPDLNSALHTPSRAPLKTPLSAQVLARDERFFTLRFNANIFEVLDQHGQLPLPPYITHPANAADEQRYQTVYAQALGAVAAPTAGLHFDDALLADLKADGIDLQFLTLHVGAGTFLPVKTQNLAEHKMHAERYVIRPETAAAITRAKAQGGRVVAVGTTSLRALEAAALHQSIHATSAPPELEALAQAHEKVPAQAPEELLQAGSGETNLFITPGFQFRVVDALLTNFHLPKSTLLMLVSAFGGHAALMHAYRHAVQQRYRFFSYGDAMLLEKNL